MKTPPAGWETAVEGLLATHQLPDPIRRPMCDWDPDVGRFVVNLAIPGRDAVERLAAVFQVHPFDGLPVGDVKAIYVNQWWNGVDLMVLGRRETQARAIADAPAHAPHGG